MRLLNREDLIRDLFNKYLLGYGGFDQATVQRVVEDLAIEFDVIRR